MQSVGQSNEGQMWHDHLGLYSGLTESASCVILVACREGDVYDIIAAEVCRDHRVLFHDQRGGEAAVFDPAQPDGVDQRAGTGTGHHDLQPDQ